MGIIPYQGKKFNSNLENNDIINNVMDEILLNETQKVSAAREAPGFLDSRYDENYLYQADKTSLEDTKEKH